jgi:hypothetical protein
MIITLKSGTRMKLEPDPPYPAAERFRVTSVEDGFFYGHVEHFYRPAPARAGGKLASPRWRPIPAGGDPQTPVQTRYEALVLLHLYHIGRIGGTKWRMSTRG